MDALDLLEQQHRDVSALIERIAVEPSAGRRGALTGELVCALGAHSRSEQRLFYGAARARFAEDGRLYEALENHGLLRFAAANLLRTRPTDARFAARLELVRELHDRHAAGEEDWAFPKAKRNLSDEELDTLGAELARAHAHLTATGVAESVRRRPMSVAVPA